MPYRTEEDSGYFKGYVPEKLDSLETSDTSQLFRFLSKIISRKDIVLLNSETLSHSVFINQKTKIRFDTLKNRNSILISKYKFINPISQTIHINGLMVKKYKWIDDGLINDDVVDIDENSFRHFSFNSKEYYYFRARIFDMFGVSAGNICYHYIYDLGNKKLSHFIACRFYKILFGDVNGDNHLDYLDFDNSDFCTTIPYSDSVTIRLYSCNDKGFFVLQKDSRGMPYFIKGNTGREFSQDSFIVSQSYWPKSIK
jgi:hypothetical protein